ncbi:MAG: hypothetical protein JXB04_11000 [Kiritimatiellae bacterium]|nr:hypothetical protein [Kiritimatiellia bacterium]
MRRIVFRIVLVLLSCTIAFALAEVLARLFLSPPQIVVVKTAGTPAGTAAPPVALVLTNEPESAEGLVLDTPAGRRLRPNMLVEVENYGPRREKVEIRTNELGYRNREVGPKHGLRILFLGDSLTFGVWLHEAETFVRRVEEAASNDARDWETVNAGIPTIGLEDELAILLETGRRTDPDVVVLGFVLNDFEESRAAFITRLPWIYRKSWFLYHALAARLQAGVGMLGRSLGGGNVASALNETVDFGKWKSDYHKSVPVHDGDYRTDPAAFNVLILQRFRAWGMAWSPHAWRHALPLFEKLKAICDENGVRLIVVCFPVRYQVDAQYEYDYPQQQLAGIMKSMEVPCLDVLSPLRALSDTYSTDDLYFDECHFTPLGNRRVAEVIHGFLASNVTQRASPGE